jgi:hypothetical protein
MPSFPIAPVPSHVSAPEVIDPMISQSYDQGYQVRRVLHMRPRFRYTVEWLGKRTDEMRVIRDFLLQQRLGTLTFSWYHPTGWEGPVIASNTTPIWLGYPTPHGLFTGMWVFLRNPVGLGPSLLAFYRVTRVDPLQVQLDGSTAAGNGTVEVTPFFPRAVARFQDNTWQGPVKLIGPESGTQGYWSWNLQVEEVF